MSEGQDPVIVCIHGVLQGSWLFEPLKTELAPLEVVALDLPGVRALEDTRPAQESMYPDVELIVQTITDLLDRGRDVIVLCHSYGGTPAGDAVGRIMSERHQMQQSHQTGRILWMIYSSSQPTFEEVCCWDSGDRIFAAAGIPKPAKPADMPGWDEKDGYLVPNAAAGPTFFSDVPDQQKWVQKLRKQSIACVLSPILAPAVGYRLVPSTYIKTLQDPVIPPGFQEGLVQEAIRHSQDAGGLVPFSDSEVGRLEIDTSHAPMLTKTVEYKGLIMQVVKRALSG